jgi:hypothetical protein
MQLGIGQAILGAIALLIAGNLGVVLFAGSTNQWRIFNYIWPIELLLSSLGLCIVMNVGVTVWLLIPCGILLGNGALFSYYAVTGNWHHWSFFWPIEPLIIILSVVGAIWLAGRGEVSRRASLVLSWVMGLSAIGWCIILSLASVIAMLFAR